MRRVAVPLCASALVISFGVTGAINAQQPDSSVPLGLQTFQRAITSAGFPCPIVQVVHTELERAQGNPEFAYRVECRAEGALEVNPKLTYRGHREKGTGQLVVRPW